MSNWVDTGSLTEEEVAWILRFVDELSPEARQRLRVERSGEDWIWHHTWAMLRLKK